MEIFKLRVIFFISIFYNKTRRTMSKYISGAWNAWVASMEKCEKRINKYNVRNKNMKMHKIRFLWNIYSTSSQHSATKHNILDTAQHSTRGKYSIFLRFFSLFFLLKLIKNSSSYFYVYVNTFICLAIFSLCIMETLK